MLKKKEGGGERERMEGMNLTRVHYMYIWKRHNETPCTTDMYNKNDFF
jgi:hypothetical protein